MSFGDSMYAFLLSMYVGMELLGYGVCACPACSRCWPTPVITNMSDQGLQEAEAKMGLQVQELYWGKPCGGHRRGSRSSQGQGSDLSIDLTL